jgi:hypothetical protein
LGIYVLFSTGQIGPSLVALPSNLQILR